MHFGGKDRKIPRHGSIVPMALGDCGLFGSICNGVAGVVGWESSEVGYKSLPMNTPMTVATKTAKMSRYFNVVLASFEFCISQLLSKKRPTASVTRGWAGRDNAILTEPAPSHTNCLKMRCVPTIICTLCWADFVRGFLI